MDQQTAPRVIGEFVDHDGLWQALRLRREELELSGESLDEIAGLTARHSLKILGCNPCRGITRITLGPLLGALALKCVLIEDPLAMRRMRKRWQKRNSSMVRNGPRRKKWKVKR